MRRLSLLILSVWVCFALLFNGYASMAYGAIPEQEREALISLYNSLGGDFWKDKSGWKTEPLEFDEFGKSGTESEWAGVTVSEGHVTEFKVIARLSTGNDFIPKEIGNLTHLETLELLCPMFTGGIPVELANLKNLRILRIALKNGSLPRWIGELSQLEILSLSFVTWDGGIPPQLGELMGLRELTIKSRRPTLRLTWREGEPKTSREEIREEAKVQAAMAQKATGSIPPELGNLINLEKLNLYGNDLSGGIPSTLGNLANLEYLDLSFNPLKGTIPPELGNLANLKILKLSGTQLEGEIPAELGRLGNLEYLELNNNQLEGSIPLELSYLEKLNLLDLSRNRLSDGIPGELGNLPRINQVWLNGNQLSGIIPLNLTSLRAGLVSLGYNALHTKSKWLTGFLNRINPASSFTQTVAPEKVKAVATSATTVRVTWTPIEYRDGKGGYEVYYYTTPGEPWTLAGMTSTKAHRWFDVEGLTPGKKYYFAVRTITQPHKKNSNQLVSGMSKEAAVVTPSQE